MIGSQLVENTWCFKPFTFETGAYIWLRCKSFPLLLYKERFVMLMTMVRDLSTAHIT